MEKKTLYLECYSGISGDMTVAALIDLGADVKVLLEGLKSLNVAGYKIEISRKTKNSIDACDFNVILDQDNHDHDMNYLFGHEHPQVQESKLSSPSPSGLGSQGSKKEEFETPSPHKGHIHVPGNHKLHRHAPLVKLQIHKEAHTHSHHEEGGHNHPHLHYGHHEHRNLNDINLIIDESAITENAKTIAKRIFYIIAVAEAKAHGKSLEEVHFHEVGAVDSIVDIVAAAVCLDNLNIGEVVVSELYEGTGHITCQHGVLPVPVPAVINIVSLHQLQLHITKVKGELVTPTGAAIVAAIKTMDDLPKDFKIKKIGLGAGKRNYEQASFLRAMLIEDITSPDISNTDSDITNTESDRVWVLEANIDDCSGEVLSIAMEVLLQSGAKDVYYTPIYMKKNRPAYLLGVICSEDKVELLEEIIFTHTTTIGLRKHESLRTILRREHITVSTPYGDALVKVCYYKDKKFCYPECESIKLLCTKSGLDYISMYSLVQNLSNM